jgi:hypothetical protein
LEACDERGWFMSKILDSEWGLLDFATKYWILNGKTLIFKQNTGF